MSERVRVASRALRRGRRLRSRSSQIPPAPAAVPSDPLRGDAGAGEEPGVPEARQAPAAPAEPARARYSRPPAPALSFEREERAPSWQPHPRSRHSRPPAPVLGLDTPRVPPVPPPPRDLQLELDTHPAIEPPASPVLESTLESRRADPLVARVVPEPPHDEDRDAPDPEDRAAVELPSDPSLERTMPSSDPATPDTRKLGGRRDGGDGIDPTDAPAERSATTARGLGVRTTAATLDAAQQARADDASRLTTPVAIEISELPPDSVPASLRDDFFRDEVESYPPIEEIEPSRADVERTRPLSAEEASRRKRLRRGVGLAVGAVAALALTLAAKAVLSPTAERAERHAATAASVMASEAPLALLQTARRSGDVGETSALPVAAPQDPDVAAAPDLALPVDSDPALLDLVTKETLRLLNERRFEEAAVWARKLIAMAPDNAFGYRCLGAALQDLGRNDEARETYSQCVTNAKRDDVYECGALGGRKK
jgi:hypothetical protein